MKIKFSDSFPLFILVLSLSMALFNPIIRENDVLRVGWAIIHTIIAVGYVTGLVILKSIRNLRALILNEKMEKVKEWAFNMVCMFEDCTYLSHEQFNEDIKKHLEKLIKFLGPYTPPEIRDQKEREK